MDIEQITEEQGDRPQWLGSLVRRGDTAAATEAEPRFEDDGETRWLGSVARREPDTSTPVETAAWNGSPGRAAGSALAI